MMNNHITSFFDGIENGEASSVPPICPIVASASLTDPPGLTRQLEFDPHHHQDIQPKDSDEMPVMGSCVHRAPAKRQHRLTKLVDDALQAAQASEYMQRVHGGQDIEERAVWVGGEIETLGSELEPGHALPDNKDQTEAQSDSEPKQRNLLSDSSVSREIRKATPGNFESHAAGQDHQRV